MKSFLGNFYRHFFWSHWLWTFWRQARQTWKSLSRQLHRINSSSATGREKTSKKAIQFFLATAFFAKQNSSKFAFMNLIFVLSSFLLATKTKASRRTWSKELFYFSLTSLLFKKNFVLSCGPCYKSILTIPKVQPNHN